MQKKIIPLLLTTSLAYAQTSTLQLETVEVRGNKEKKTQQETNESTYIVKEDAKATPLKENSLDALNAISNVTVNKEEETFTIRGVKNIGVTGYQKDNLASIIVDNIYQSDLAVKAGSFNLFDLNTLEIFRGAQSTTQGVNSLAGSINVYHNRADRFSENKLYTELGNYGKFNAGLTANTPLIDNKLYSKITGNVLTSNGTVTNTVTNNKKWGEKSYYNGTVDLTYMINGEDTLKMTNKYFKSKTGGSYVDGPNPYDYTVRENQDSSIKTTNAQSGIEYNKVIDDNFSNTLLIGYSNSKQDTNTDSDLTEFDKTGSRLDYHRDNYLSFENLLNYKNENIKNVTGLHVHRYSLIDNYDFNVIWNPRSTTTLNIKQYVDRKRETYALFDSFTYSLTEAHTFNLGMRYEIVKNEYLTNVSGGRNGSTGSASTDAYLDKYIKDRSGAYGGDSDNGKFLPKAGYTYSFNKDHSIGATLSEGYRTGGVSINRYRTTAVNYNPETTYNYELSYRGHVNDLKISQNLFYSDWRNQQVQISLSSDSYDTQVENASSSQYFGGEFDVAYDISAAQAVSASIGYVDTRFNSFKKGSTNYAGKEFPNAPKWTLMANHGIEVFKNTTLKSTLRYLSKSFADAENTKSISEQFYADLALAYAVDSYQAELKVKNLFDNRYTTNSFTNLYGTYYQMSTPREISVNLSSTW